VALAAGFAKPYETLAFPPEDNDVDNRYLHGARVRRTVKRRGK